MIETITTNAPVSAKFNVTKVARMANGQTVATMQPVTDVDNMALNTMWTGAAKGKAEITVTNNQHADFFVPGASYSVTYTRLPDAEVAEKKPTLGGSALKKGAGLLQPATK